MIKIHQEPEETRQRAAAALQAPNQVQGVVLARVEQDQELLDLGVDQQEAALEVAEQALREVDHRLILQDSRVEPLRYYLEFEPRISYMGLQELARLGEV